MSSWRQKGAARGGGRGGRSRMVSSTHRHRGGGGEGLSGGDDTPKGFDTARPVLELAVVMDGTMSMRKHFESFHASLTTAMSWIKDAVGDHATVKWAVVVYTDFPKKANIGLGEFAAETLCDFETDTSRVASIVEAYKGATGYDWAEDFQSGVQQALDLSWTEHSLKVFIGVLDAPPHGIGKEKHDNYPQGSPTGLDTAALWQVLLEEVKVDRIVAIGCQPNLGKDKKALEFVRDMMPMEDELGNPDNEAFLELHPGSDIGEKLGMSIVSAFLDKSVLAGGRRELEALLERQKGIKTLTEDGSVRKILPGDTASIEARVRRAIHRSHSSDSFIAQSHADGALLSSKFTLSSPRPIGRGGFGTVFRGKYAFLTEERSVAAKAVCVETGEHGLPSSEVVREIRALVRFGQGQHPIVRFYGFFAAPPAIVATMGLEEARKGHKWVLLLFRLYDSDLVQWIKSNSSCSLEEAVGIVKQIALGLRAIHTEGKILQDLKPANVLMDMAQPVNERAVICDLGFVASADGTSAVGYTLGYCAPEVLSRASSPTTASDIYSFGKTLEEFFDRVAVPDSTFKEEMLALILRCVDKDPTKRPHIAEIIRTINATTKASPRAPAGLAPLAEGRHEDEEEDDFDEDDEEGWV